MSILNHIHFKKADPLANGLADEIAAEQHEAEAIHSFEDTSAEELEKFWTGVVQDAKRDPDWFNFFQE